MRKYLLRLLSFSLILGALPTVFIGLVSYYIATKDIEEKVNEGNMQLLLQTQMRVEQTLKLLEMSATQLTNSSLVQAAMNTPLASEDFVPVRELITELTLLQTKAVVKQAYLVNFNYDWVVNLGVLKKLNDVSKKQFQSYATQPASLYWTAENLSGSGGSTGTEAGGNAKAAPADTVSLIQKIPILPKTNSPRGLLVVQLSAGDFRSILTPNNRLGNNYILDASGQAFLSTTQEMSGHAEINRQISELARDPEQKQGFIHSTVDGKKVMVLYRSSGYNGWTYVSVVSLDEITKDSKKIAFLTAAACGLILLFVVIFAYFGTRRMYSPIRSLFELTQASGADARSDGKRKDELEYIRESMETLAVSRSRLEEQMQGQTAHLKEFFVLKLFTGQISDDDFAYRSRIYGFPTDWSRLGVLALQIDPLQEPKYQEQDRELLLFAINNIVAELLPAHSRFSPILLNQSQVTLLAVKAEDAHDLRAYFYRTAELIKDKVGQYLQLQVSVGISNDFEKLSDAVKAYGESLAALKCRISLGPDIIVHYEDMEKNGEIETAVYSHLLVMENQLIQALRELKLEKAEDIFQQYLASLITKEGLVGEHHFLLMQLMSRVLQLIQEQGVSVKRMLDGEDAVERFSKLQTREEITLWFHSQLFAPIVAMLAERTDTQFMKIADRLVKIIHEQYDQNITLESCAAALNFHPVYLSRVFKKEMDIKFSDYLSEYRMNKGKEMLETTTMKISEIGEKLQYKNTSAFIRTFRKTFGTTPGQYREEMDKEKNQQ